MMSTSALPIQKTLLPIVMIKTENAELAEKLFQLVVCPDQLGYFSSYFATAQV